jgi:hypothetical protein
MTFKMGETCDGCDAIVKNLKKIDELNKKNKYQVKVEGKNQAKSMTEFLEDSVEDNKKATNKVAKNLKETGKYKVGKY